VPEVDGDGEPPLLGLKARMATGVATSAAGIEEGDA
jgi:hypothetical protein